MERKGGSAALGSFFFFVMLVAATVAAWLLVAHPFYFGLVGAFFVGVCSTVIFLFLLTAWPEFRAKAKKRRLRRDEVEREELHLRLGSEKIEEAVNRLKFWVGFYWDQNEVELMEVFDGETSLAGDIKIVLAAFQREREAREKTSGIGVDRYEINPEWNKDYPNLVAVLEGRVSGRVGEWPRIRPELFKLFGEKNGAEKIGELKRALKELKVWLSFLCRDIGTGREGKTMAALPKYAALLEEAIKEGP